MVSTKRKSKAKSTDKPVPVDRPRLQALTGSDKRDFSLILLNQVINTIWCGSNCSEEQKDQLVQFGLAMMEEIGPRDGIEGMLAAQMAAVHCAALDCFRRSASPDQTFAGRDMSLRYGTRLSRLFTEQIAALEKYRGKGQQTVVVERVNVGEGGRAVVGNVSGGEGQTSNREELPHAKALGHAQEPTLPSADEKGDALPVAGDAER